MAGVSTSLSIQDRMTSALNKITAAVARSNRALEITDRLSDQVDPGAGFERGASAINIATQNIIFFNEEQERTRQGARGVESIWGRIGTLLKTALAAFSIKKIIDLSDSLTQTTARLNLINDGLQTTDQLQSKIVASANRARASYTDTAAVVAKLGTLAGSAFKSNDEMIAFTELMNKNFVIGGASIQEQTAAMYQLTQAMASGRLQGDEFRSIMENAPMLAQAIAKFTGKSMADLREMSAEGQITADIIKGAMFSTADEVNRKFAEIPMTFGQVTTVIGNTLLQTFQPVIQTIGKGAQWIYDNWSILEPIFWGLVAAVGAFALITGIWTAVTWLQVAANRALLVSMLVSMLTNPILWIAIAIGIVIGLIYQWVQSVGGLRVAWLIVCNALLTAWDWVQIGFMTGVYWVMDMWNRLQLAFMTAGVNIANFMGDMKANVLMILQNMVNGAIGIINGFIETLNKIPGVSIGLIDEVTFGTTAQLENEAAKQARNQGLEDYRSQVESQIAERDAKLNQMKTDAQAATAQRQAEIATARAEAANKKAQDNADLTDKFSNGDIANVGSVGEVGKIKDDVNIADEDLKFFRDVAEMRYVQNFVTLTPTVAVDAQISERVDVDEVVSRIETKLEDEFVMAAEGVYS